MLLDSVGIGYIFSPIFHRLKADGVPAARFLHTWLPWRMPFLNMRNHRKLLVVDGSDRLHRRHEYRRGKFRAAWRRADYVETFISRSKVRWCAR